MGFEKTYTNYRTRFENIKSMCSFNKECGSILLELYGSKLANVIDCYSSKFKKENDLIHELSEKGYSDEELEPYYEKFSKLGYEFEQYTKLLNEAATLLKEVKTYSSLEQSILM